jgi:hypothetical protein
MIKMWSHKPKQISSLLGLEWDDQNVQAALVRRASGAAKIEKVARLNLSLDPLTDEPELVGRELRQQLDEAGIRERHCVVGIPQSWALTTQTRLPDLHGQDLADFLQIQAEKNFAYPPEDLSIATSHASGSGGERYATLVAVPKQHLDLLERALKAARLKPLSFSFGITALQFSNGAPAQSRLILSAGEQHLGLQVFAGGGVVSLRVLRGAFHKNGAGDEIDADNLARELRITLGRLPNDLRKSVTELKIFGRSSLSHLLQEQIAPHAARLGLAMEINGHAKSGFLEKTPECAQSASALAARHLTGKPVELEFLPPKPNLWQARLAKFSSGKSRTLGFAGAGLLALLIGVFVVQHWRLARVEEQWRTMGPTVREVETLQNQIRQFRPWFDNSFPTLSVLNLLAEVFPEDAALSAKTVEVRNGNMISCSGTARDPQQLLQAHDRLSQNPNVTDLKVQHMQGTPLQFIFHFRWTKGGQDESER